MQFDLEAARNSGATDDQIADFLAQQHGRFDLGAARKAGVKSSAVIPFLMEDLKRGNLPSGVEPSTAGAGRGSVNPTDADQTTRGVMMAVDGDQSATPKAPAGLASAPRRGTMRAVTPYGAGDARVNAPKAGDSVLDRVDTTAMPDQGLTPQQMEAGSVAPWKQQQDAAIGRYRSGAGAPVARAGDPMLDLSGQAGRAVAGATGSQRLGALAEGAADTYALAPEALAATTKLGVDIANLATLGAAQPVSDWLDQTIGVINNAKSARFQEGRKAFAEVMQNPDAGVLDVAAFMAANPRFAVEIGAPSIPSMLLGAGGARLGAAMLAGRGAAATGAKIGAGAANVAMNAGSTFSDTNGDLSQKLLAAGAAGAGTALLGRMDGAETTLAAGRSTGRSGAALRTGMNEGVQEAGESLSQSIGQGTAEGNFDLNQSLKQATTEGVIGGLMGAGAGAASPESQPAQPRPMSAEQLDRSKGFLRPAQARAETLSRLDDLAAEQGIPSAVVEKLKKASDGKPLAELSGWFKRALGNLGQRGVIRPLDDAALSVLDEQPDSLQQGPQDRKAETPAPGQREAAPQTQEAALADDVAAGLGINTTAPQTLDAGALLAGDGEGMAGSANAPIPPGSEIGDINPNNPPAPQPATSGDAAPIAGEPINRNWSKFSPDSGTLGIPRSDMPQVAASDRGAFINFMNARGVMHQTAELPAMDLKPTQAEFSPSKVERFKAGGGRSILVSNDGYVIDGHHQWVSAREQGQPVKAIVLDAPVADVLRLAHQFPSSFTAKGPTRADSGSGNADAGRTEGRGPADGRAGPGTAPLVSGEQPQPAAAGTAEPAVSVAGAGDAPGATGPARGDTALTAGQAVTLDGQPYTVKSASPKVIRLTGPDGKARVISSESANWSKIIPASGAPEASAPATSGESNGRGQEGWGQALLTPGAPQRESTTDAAPTPATEVYAGQFGEGLAEHNAKLKAQEFAKSRPDMAWTVAETEAHSNPKFKPGRYVVEGRPKEANAAQASKAPAPRASGEARAEGVPATGPAPAAETAGVKAKRGTKLTPHDDPRLTTDEGRQLLEGARPDIGWIQVGGQIIRDPRTAVDPDSPDAHREGDVVGRTPWVGSDLWRNRPEQGGKITEAEAKDAIDKGVAGKPMTTRQKRFVSYVLDSEQDRERQRVEQATNPNIDDFWGMDDLADSGYTGLAEDEQVAADAILAEVDRLGLDRERIIEDASREAEGLTTKEYHAILKRIADEAVAEYRGRIQQADAGPAGEGAGGDGGDAQAPGRPASERADGPVQAVQAEGLTSSGPSPRYQRLEKIAENIGVTVFKAGAGWHATGSMVEIPDDDVDAQGAVSPAHVFAHELGHAIMMKRGFSFQGFPKTEVLKRIANYDDLIAASKEFRPGVHQHENAQYRRHAMKPNEVLADSIAAVLIGDKDIGLIRPLMEATGLTERDLGLVGKAPAADVSEFDLQPQSEAEALAEAARRDKALSDERAKKDAEQARLKREDDAKEAKVRADQSVDDFQLGQSAEQQLSGQRDIFSEPAADEAKNDRNHFTLDRVDQETGSMVPVTFTRGQRVKVSRSHPMRVGVLDGISHAERRASVDGLWTDFGYVYPESYDEFKQHREGVSKQLDRLEQRLNDKNSIEAKDMLRAAQQEAKHYLIADEFKAQIDRLQQQIVDVEAANAEKFASQREAGAQRRSEPPTPPKIDPIKMTMEEWKAVPKDYKGITDGVRTVMRGGGLVTVEIVKPIATDQTTDASAEPSRPEALIALRKRLSVLQSLRSCIG